MNLENTLFVNGHYSLIASLLYNAEDQYSKEVNEMTINDLERYKDRIEDMNIIARILFMMTTERIKYRIVVERYKAELD